MLFLCVSASDCVSDVGPASVIVGNLVQGNRLASAQGRDMGLMDDDSDSSKKVSSIHFFNIHFFQTVFLLFLLLYFGVISII